MATDISHVYKIYRDGTYLGDLSPVTSDFNYTQKLFTAGASMQITVDTANYTAPDAVENITTQNDVPITTESGANLTTQRTPDYIGNDNPLALMRNENEVRVYEYSSDYPNGLLVFRGYISRTRGAFGGSNDVVLTVLSDGTELDNYLIQGVPVVDQSQTSKPSRTIITTSQIGWVNRVWQSFVIGTGVTQLAGFEVWVEGISTIAGIKVKIFSTQAEAENPAADLPALAEGSAAVVSGEGQTLKYLGFANALDVSPGQTYYAMVTVSTPIFGFSNSVYIYYSDASDVYPSGTSAHGTTSPTFSWASYPASGSTTGDFYFKTYAISGATEVPYTSDDPSVIIQDFMDSYTDRGGVITYDASSIDLTGDSIDYTFKMNTILEGIRKMLDASPGDFYWYVDPATRLLYFKQTSTTPDHTLILGTNIDEMISESTIEGIKNLAYFTGGDTGGGSNLFLSDSNTESLALHRVGLERLADNRVTITATGEAILANFLERYPDETYESPLTVPTTGYDLNLINLGETVGFGGFGNFIDRLVLQVVSKNKTATTLNLQLGVLPKSIPTQIELLTRALQELQNVDNPDTPS